MRAVLLLVLSCIPARAELAIVQARLQSYEDGPAVAASRVFKGGETIFLSFHFSGYGRTSDEDAPKMHVTYRIEAVDPEGTPVVGSKSGSIEAALAVEDKNWLPKVRYQFVLPETPAPGLHEIRIIAKDEISGQEAAHKITFAVDKSQVAPAASLGVVNFKWDRTAVRPGEAFEARFAIAGYRLGEKNAYNIRYGVAFVDGAGKPVFSDANAAALSGESFYPRRFLPAAMSLRLDGKVKPGTYRLRIDVEDLVSGQKRTEEFPIRVTP